MQLLQFAAFAFTPSLCSFFSNLEPGKPTDNTIDFGMEKLEVTSEGYRAGPPKLECPLFVYAHTRNPIATMIGSCATLQILDSSG